LVIFIAIEADNTEIVRGYLAEDNIPIESLMYPGVYLRFEERIGRYKWVPLDTSFDVELE